MENNDGSSVEKEIVVSDESLVKNEEDCLNARKRASAKQSAKRKEASIMASQFPKLKDENEMLRHEVKRLQEENDFLFKGMPIVVEGDDKVVPERKTRADTSHDTLQTSVGLHEQICIVRNGYRPDDPFALPRLIDEIQNEYCIFPTPTEKGAKKKKKKVTMLADRVHVGKEIVDPQLHTKSKENGRYFWISKKEEAHKNKERTPEMENMEHWIHKEFQEDRMIRIQGIYGRGFLCLDTGDCSLDEKGVGVRSRTHRDYDNGYIKDN